MTSVKKKSKKEQVLDYLRTHDSITSLEAIGYFTATRLSAIIYDLRHEGHAIGDRWEHDGHGVSWKAYYLMGE